MFYGTSVDAFLFMGAAVSVPLPAPVIDTFTEVPLLGTITPPSKEITTAYFNVLNDTFKRSVGGKKADQSTEGDIVMDWDEIIHRTMSADVDVAGGQKRNWRIQYPNGRVLNFRGFLSRWNEESFDASADAKEHRAAFTITVDGLITDTYGSV